MPKALKPRDFKKLKDALCRISSLSNCIKIILDDSPTIVSFTGTGVIEGSDRIFVIDTRTKASICEAIKILLVEEKDDIRKRYGVDIE